MMRFAFIVLLSVLCLSAKASDDPKEAKPDVNDVSGVEPTNILKRNAGVQLESDSADFVSESTALEPQTSHASHASQSSQSTKPVLKDSSAGEAESKQSTLPLKKVSVSEASNWPFVLLTLLAMIICILLIAWMVKRFTGLTGLGGRDLKIVSAIAVGSRERVAVVEVKGEQFLIGATPHNISLLHHFSEEELEAASAKNAIEQSKAPSAFADKLQSILKQTPAADSEIK